MISIAAGAFVALVDDEDARLADLRWHTHQSGRNVYACHTLHPRAGGHVMLHHFILPRVPGRDVDHQNGKSLDNRRSNLRYLSHSQNVREGKQRHPRPASESQRDVDIRGRRAAGETFSKLAAAFGLSKARVHQICSEGA